MDLIIQARERERERDKKIENIQRIFEIESTRNFIKLLKSQLMLK